MVAAGFVLPIDDPGLPNWWDMLKPEPTIEAYRKFAELRTDAVNRALVGIPEERVRYQLCWGSWHGPHSQDVPLSPHARERRPRIRPRRTRALNQRLCRLACEGGSGSCGRSRSL
jgi:hypothetical protein